MLLCVKFALSWVFLALFFDVSIPKIFGATDVGKPCCHSAHHPPSVTQHPTPNTKQRTTNTKQRTTNSLKLYPIQKHRKKTCLVIEAYIVGPWVVALPVDVFIIRDILQIKGPLLV